MSAALRCGLLGLSIAETALIRTLFKLYQLGTGDFRWILVEAAPYDALLVDADVADGAGAGLAVLTLGGSALAGQPDALARPLRSEMLEAWLLRTQRVLLANPLPAGGQALAASPATTPAAAPLPAQFFATPAEAALHKLTRWPPAAMLRNDPALIRMATMLARRPMKVGELAQVSQQSVEAANTFVSALRDAGLLEKAAQQAAARAPRTPVAARPTHAPAKHQRGLVSRIRLRLGL